MGLYCIYRIPRASIEERPGLGIVPLVAVGYPLVAAAQNVTVFGATPIFGSQGRYFTNILVLWAVLCALGATAIRKNEKLSKYALWPVIVLVVGALACKQWQNSYAFAMNVKNVNEMNVAVAVWADENLPENARLAVNDVGAIARFTDREVIDVLGLVSPDAWPYLERGQRGVFDYIKETRPDYLIVFPKWFPLLVRQADYFTPIHTVSIDDNTIVGSDLMIVYECSFPPKDRGS